MLTWILIICIIFFLGAVFYKQTIQEYKLNQIEWDQADRLPELLEEGTPFIVRSTPICPIWTSSDVSHRPDFKELADWVKAAGVDAQMPWHEPMARLYGRQALLDPWLDEIWMPVLPRIRSLLNFIFPRDIQLWAGGRGLYEHKAAWTLLFPTQGTVIVTMMSKKEDKYMPANWQGRFAESFTVADSPYVSQLKYLDIKLRPGTALFVPAHWKVSWMSGAGTQGQSGATVEASEDNTNQIPFMAIVGFHTPISKLASLAAGPVVAPRPKPATRLEK